VATIIPILRKTELFSELDADDLQKVADIIHSENYEPGDVVAEAVIFSGEGYPVSLEVIEPARLKRGSVIINILQ